MTNEADTRSSLESRIDQKWRDDCLQLPLTEDHRELYNIVHNFCWCMVGRLPNLVNCCDFNDRMQWLKLFDQREETVLCSDKVQVRDFIQSRIGKAHLVELYQVHDHFYQINFDALPNAFVIKANHDSGTTIIVRDKSKLDIAAGQERIESSLAKIFGWERGEWAYKYIRPKVMVEELIEPESCEAPADYKFFCVNGEVRFLHYIYDRGFQAKEQTIDLDGRDLETPLYEIFTYGNQFQKPNRWDEMISIAEKLSNDFKFVRVDLYNAGNSIYAGELTFWPGGGGYSGKGQEALGQLLDIDRSTFKPFLLPILERKRTGARSDPVIASSSFAFKLFHRALSRLGF